MKRKSNIAYIPTVELEDKLIKVFCSLKASNCPRGKIIADIIRS
jgi:hypothetical protein